MSSLNKEHRAGSGTGWFRRLYSCYGHLLQTERGRASNDLSLFFQAKRLSRGGPALLVTIAHRSDPVLGRAKARPRAAYHALQVRRGQRQVVFWEDWPRLCIEPENSILLGASSPDNQREVQEQP